MNHLPTLRFYIICVSVCLLAGLVYGAVGPEDRAVTNDEVEVELLVVSPSSLDEVVKEADTSAQIQLRAVVRTTDGTPAPGVSLFDCEAATANYTVVLTSFNGCPAHESPLSEGCMARSDGTIVSPVFPLFSLADGGEINITCSWETCTARNYLKCVDRCGFFSHPFHMHGGAPKSQSRGWRKRRDTARDEAASPRRHVSTTVRVISSSTPERHRSLGDPYRHGHHHGSRSHGSSSNRHRSRLDEEAQKGSSSTMSGHHDDMRARESADTVNYVLMYLNPITCSIFLIVIIVFLGLYASFVRSLKTSVELLRRDVLEQHGQQYRDKFLVPR